LVCGTSTETGRGGGARGIREKRKQKLETGPFRGIEKRGGGNNLRYEQEKALKKRVLGGISRRKGKN